MKNLIKTITPTVITKNYRLYKQKLINIRKSIHKEETFENVFNYRSDDIVIVSFPRSGSTWLRFIFSHLINDIIGNESKEIDFSNLNNIVPAISKLSQDLGVDYESLPSPRIMRSHSLYNPKFPKIIYLIRDGRDVLVSYFYYFRKIHGYKATIYEFLKGDVSQGNYGGWGEHVNSWLFKNEYLSNLYLVKYEDLIKDPYKEIEQLINFIGLQVTVKKIKNIVDKCSFNKMKKIEKIKGLGPVLDKGDSRISFIRKGSSGQWKDELGDKEKDIIKEKYGNVLIKAGYEPSFNW